MSQHIHDSRKAEFSERGLAFAADVALFAAAWVLILKAISPALPVLHNERGAALTLILAGIFILYQAFFSCEGRSSLGKSLFGLRVADSRGEPLDLTRAVVRSLTYLPSSIFTLGFFWALVDPHGRAWHDMTVGSDVLSDRPLSGARHGVLRLAAGTLVIAFALAAGWNGIWEPRYLKLMTVAQARAGLGEIKSLQGTYHKRHGRYAGSVYALASVSVDPGTFLLDMASLYDLKSFRFIAGRDKYAIATRARDVDSTLIAASGP